jgi:nucleotide-binding universal stress UspA family protein
METSPRRILVAVDGSDQSFEAVRYAGRILPQEQVRITLFHVLNLFPESFWDLEPQLSVRHQVSTVHAWEHQQKQRAEEFMEKSKRLLLSQGHSEMNISVAVKERDVDVARDIIKEAQKGYQTLVIGRHGMSELKDLIFGSIANKLVSHLHQVPVWVVGGRPDPARILIAMDPSEGSRRALEYIADIFSDKHPELLLLHVTRGLDIDAMDYERLSAEEEQQKLGNLKEQFDRAETQMMALLRNEVARLQAKGMVSARIKTKIVPGVYSRAAAILGEAQDGDYGTIVVGRRGLSRVEEFIMGRVSNKVLQLARELAVWVVQ